MSTKNIPAQTIKTCDACQCAMDGRNSRENGGLHLKRDALDFQGSPCADASVRLDLCDSCLHKVATAINASVAAIAATPGATHGN